MCISRFNAGVRGAGQGEIGGAVGQPTGHGPGMGFKGGLPAFLEVSLSDSDGRFFGLLDRTGHAQAVGTDEESDPHVHPQILLTRL
jgi:hypothetical protein